MANKRIKDLATTATEADLVSGNYLALDGSAGTKKLPSNCIAPKSVQDVLVTKTANIESQLGNYTIGAYLATTGAPVSDIAWGYTDYVAVSEGSLECSAGAAKYEACIIFYNSSKVQVTYKRMSYVDETFTVESGYAYARMSVNIASIFKAYMKQGGVSIWEPSGVLEELHSNSDKLENEIPATYATKMELRNYTAGAYLSNLGAKVTNSSWGYTDFIPVEDGDIEFSGGVADANACCCIYNSDYELLNGVRENTDPRTFTLPAGAAFVRISVNIDKRFGAYLKNNDTTLWRYDGVYKEIDLIKEDVAALSGIVSNYVPGGYLSTTGSLVTDENWGVSDFIPVSENDAITFSGGAVNNNACLCLYDGYNSFVNYVRLSSLERTYTIPSDSGISYAKLSLNIGKNSYVKKGSDILFAPDGIFNDLSIISENLEVINSRLDGTVTNYKEGVYISTDGSEVANSDWCAGDFYEIPADTEELTFRGGAVNNNAVLAVYNSSKELVQYMRLAYAVRTLSVLETYKYVRLSFYKENTLDAMIIIDGDKVWWPIGSEGISEKVDDLCSETKIIRVGAYNTGTFDAIDMVSGSDEVAMVMRKALAKARIDVLCTQEDRIYFNTAEQTLSKDEVFGMYQFYSLVSDQGTNNNGFASCYPISNFERVVYDSTGMSPQPAHPSFYKCQLDVGNFKILLISVHLDWRDNSVRQEELRQIAAYAENYDDVIICGDFNPENCINDVPQYDPVTQEGKDTSAEDLAILEAAGFVPANSGYFGKYNTFYSSYLANYTWPCDNICIKSSRIKILDFNVLQEDWMNDHFIISADISINE